MIIAWSIIILATIPLIVFIQRNNRKREKKIYSVLHSFASDNDSKISSYDRWDKTLIGIDTNEICKLFFIRTIGNKEFKEVINLSEVTKCRLIKTERTVLVNKENVNVIDKIAVVFSFRNIQRQEISLEFYNNDYDQLTLSGELQLAEKWTGIIGEILNTEKNKNIEDGKAKTGDTFLLKEPIIHAQRSVYSI